MYNAMNCRYPNCKYSLFFDNFHIKILNRKVVLFVKLSVVVLHPRLADFMLSKYGPGYGYNE